MGRTREFDADKALDAAMRVFWTRGYEGASLQALTDAMGINKPSLYAAFGNKEELFKRALARYVEGPAAGVAHALEAATGREAVAKLLDLYASAAGVAGRPRGCLIVNSALRCSEDDQHVEIITKEYRDASRLALQQRLERARRDGERLPGKPAELARWVWTVLHGMAIDSADGATADELRKIAHRTMLGWPAD